MPVCALPWPRGLFIQFAHLLNGSSAPHFAHSALQNVSYGHRQGVQCWVLQQYHQMPDTVRFLFPVFPLISPFMSCYILICGCYLLRLNSAFFSPSPSSAGLGLPTACCVQCPAAGREWRAVSVSSHTQQPWVVAMA